MSTAASAHDETWEYISVLNECIQILLTIGIGVVMGYIRVFDAQAFLSQATKFVFYVALPLHVFKGIGIAVNFYDDSFLWTFIAAFLVLRVIGLILSLVATAFAGKGGGGDKNDGTTGGAGQVAVTWLALTWISTIILGVPILGAVFGDPIKGRTYGILAAISSFIFQLPLTLFLLECHLLEREYLAGGNDGGPEIKEQQRNGSKIHHARSTPPGEEDPDDGLPSSFMDLVAATDGKEDPEQPPALNVKTSSFHGLVAAADRKEDPNVKESFHGQPPVMTESENRTASLGHWLEPSGGIPPGNRTVSLGLWRQWACTWAIWKKIFFQLMRNPVLWGIIAGFFFSLTTIGPRYLNPTSDEYVPGLGFIFATATWLGECVSPVALITMGVWMQAQGRKLTRIPPVSAILYMMSKLIVTPLIVLALALLFNLNDEAGRAAILIAALPISMAAFSLADRYGIGQAVLSENVALGTLLILPTIILWNMALDAVGLFPVA